MNLEEKRKEEMISRAQTVAVALLGTCKSLESEATEEETNDSTFCAQLDSEIFNCENCGWWCGIEEHHVSGHGEICDDCLDELEDADEDDY